MYKRILVATDGSKLSQQAVDHAIRRRTLKVAWRWQRQRWRASRNNGRKKAWLRSTR
jgi:nucleotide-binding universal stress UspA family protein